MDCLGSGEGEKEARRDKMKSRTAKRNRKSTVRLSDELASMDAETKYLTPIFGSEASDVEMPNRKLNRKPLEPRIVAENDT